MVTKKNRTTIRDVARLAEVAPITVSRVVNNAAHISPETRRRVEQAIEDLNYIPNVLSQNLRFQKTDIVTLLVSDITNPFWTTATRGVEDVCNAEGLNVVLCNTDEQPEKLEKYIQLLMRRQTDGFLIVPTGHDTQALDVIQRSEVPLVLLDRVVPGVNASSVRSDGEHGAYMMTSYLLDLGHRRIAMLAGGHLQSTSQQRVAGYRRALIEAGLPVDESLIKYGSYTQQSGYEMTVHFIQTTLRPTAYFAANNFIAYGVQKALQEKKLRIPHDASLATFDAQPYPGFPSPFFTTINQDPYRIGYEAARLLVEQIQNPGEGQPLHLVLPVELLLNDSTAAPPD